MNKRELKEDFYDNAYIDSKKYNSHYKKTPYFKDLWPFVLSKLNKEKDIIADFGCGPGQFPNYLVDEGFKLSYGTDFSEVAIEKSKELLPEHKFYVCDMYKKDTYTKHKYNTAICLEVLEHLTNDFKFFEYLPKGCKIIVSVPNFDSISHVRYFKDLNEVKKRYKDQMKIQGGKTIYLGNKQIFILFGTK
jgi:2-polyprenyl-3-methyl-5-hydroxy-6-metoxy-1,4-benzoquinol methylase